MGEGGGKGGGGGVGLLAGIGAAGIVSGGNYGVGRGWRRLPWVVVWMWGGRMEGSPAPRPPPARLAWHCPRAGPVFNNQGQCVGIAFQALVGTFCWPFFAPLWFEGGHAPMPCCIAFQALVRPGPPFRAEALGRPPATCPDPATS